MLLCVCSTAADDRHRFSHSLAHSWEPGTQLPPAQLSKSREVFVVDGAWSDEQHERYTSGSWLRLPAGSVFGGSSECGCTLFVHDGLNEANH